MEQRLIDANALCESPLYFVGDEVFVNIKAVENAPTVDAVPVVRCRECKWFGEFCDEYKQKTGKDGTCEHPKFEQYAIRTTFDYYCADGEREDDENN